MEKKVNQVYEDTQNNQQSQHDQDDYFEANEEVSSILNTEPEKFPESAKGEPHNSSID